MLGRFVAILLEPVSDEDKKPSFLNCALALNSNLPFWCEKLQMADRSLMHMRTHDRFDVWIASTTRDSRSMSPPPTYKLLRLMTPGATVERAISMRGRFTNSMHDMEDTHVLSMCMALHCNLPPLRQWAKGQGVEVASKLAANARFDVRP